MAAGYCRISSCILSVNIFNSILVTGWDVLQAETWVFVFNYIYPFNLHVCILGAINFI